MTTIITVPFIPGDGIGPEIMQSTQLVTDAAMEKVYWDSKRIERLKLMASEEAYHALGDYLPQETIDLIIKHGIAIKWPMRTPTGWGHKSLNVALRKILDLYACVRPIKYSLGTPMPMKNPYGVDFTIFRENTDDVYQGIDYSAGSDRAQEIIDLVNQDGYNVPLDSGIGIKPISREKTRRIVEAAIQDTIKQGRKRITIMHKGNIQKQTEWAFAKWAFEYVQEQYPDIVCLRPTDESPEWVQKLKEGWDRVKATNCMYMDELIADNTFAQAIKNPQQFDTIVAPNLNGDYISDAGAEIIGGLGVWWGININYDTGVAVAEAIHGTANDRAWQNQANAISLELSMALLLDHIGESEVSQILNQAIRNQIKAKVFTGDLMNVINKNGTLVDEITYLRSWFSEHYRWSSFQEIDALLFNAIKKMDVSKIISPRLVGTKEQAQDLVTHIRSL